MSERPADAIRRTLLLAVLVAVPAIFAVKAPDDPDIFWHIRTGAWILANKSFPDVDPFSQIGATRPWVAYSWLFEVVVHEIHQIFGWAGIVWASALASSALAALLARLVIRLEPRFSRAIVLAAIGTVGILRLSSPRPWLVTIAFFIVTVQAIFDMRKSGKIGKAWLLILLFAVWANVHIQFVYGLFALGLLASESILGRALARKGVIPTQMGPAPQEVVLLTGACALATLANPYGWRVWRVVFEYAGGTGAFAAVNELRALEFRSIPDWAVLACVLAGTFALGWRRERRPFPYLLLAASALFAFRAGRDAWFAAIAGTAVAADSGATASELESFSTTKVRLLLVAIGLLAALGLVTQARAIKEPAISEAIAKNYPAESCAWVEAHDAPGPLFNDFDWGGYLIWRLPKLPVSIDGRTNLHGDERIARSIATWRGEPGWQSDPELATAKLVIAPRSAPLANLLRSDPRFTLVHEDAVALVFTAR